MTVEGVPNQLYSQGMRAYQQCDEIIKYFALTSKRNKVTDQVAKDLFFTEINLGKYLTKHYALWLVLRTTADNSLHGSRRAVSNVSEGITIQIAKKKKKKNGKNFEYISIYNTRCTEQFRRGMIQSGSLLSFQNMPTLQLVVAKLNIKIFLNI